MQAMRTLGLLLVCIATSLPSFPTFASTKSLPDQILLYELVRSRLAIGNTVIFTVPVSASGPAGVFSKDCSSGAIINARGQKEAAAIATGIRKLGKPLGAISSSQDCLAMSTATFIKANPELPIHITPDLNPVNEQRKTVKIDDAIKELTASHLRLAWLAHTNVIVSHPHPPETAVHPALIDLATGETAIFYLSDTNQVEFVAKLNQKQWLEMTKYYAGRSTIKSTGQQQGKQPSPKETRPKGKQ